MKMINLNKLTINLNLDNQITKKIMKQKYRI